MDKELIAHLLDIKGDIREIKTYRKIDAQTLTDLETDFKKHADDDKKMFLNLSDQITGITTSKAVDKGKWSVVRKIVVSAVGLASFILVMIQIIKAIAT